MNATLGRMIAGRLGSSAFAGLLRRNFLRLDEGRHAAPVEGDAQPGELKGVLWPSLGYPALVEARDTRARISVLVCLCHDTVPAPGLLAANLIPVSSAAAEPISLTVVGASHVTLDSVRIGRWPAWVKAHAGPVLRIECELPIPSLPRRTNLFDLQLTCDGERFSKPGAVAIQRPATGFTVALASDIHVASRWDSFEQSFSRVFESSSPDAKDRDRIFSREAVLNSFLNPNRNLGLFIRRANELASKDQLDAVVLSGDLVDFKYRRDRANCGTSYEDTEWKFLQDILLGDTKHAPRLEVPLFTTTGNHDYRLYPYRVRTYGIRHAGIPDQINEYHARQTGDWGWPKYRPGDLDAIRVSLGDDHSLNYYFRDFNPCLDYEVSLGGAEFLFLDTGPDANADLDHLSGSRRRRFLRGSVNISHPYSNGFDDAQINYLKEWSKRNTDGAKVIVAHAPLIVPPAVNQRLGEDRRTLLRLPDAHDTLADAFEDSLADSGLDAGCVIRNQLPIFNALRAHKGPTFYFAGHCHSRAEMAVDKASGALSIAVSAPAGNQALLFNTPALAHYDLDDARGGDPSYRLIRLEHGAVTSVELVPVIDGALDEWVYEWACTRESASVERIDFFFHHRLAGAVPAHIKRRLILRFNKWHVTQDAIAIADPGAVVESGIDPGHADDSIAYWLLSDAASFTIRVNGRPKGSSVSFIYDTLTGDTWSGLRWHFRALH